jgi:alpha-tubulin suppressor-like RCC1 family protein
VSRWSGAVAGSDHFLARTANGLVLGWGLNIEGQVGDDSFTDRGVPTFADLPNGATVTALAAGNKESYALTSQGKVLAWGQGNSGELGNGAFSNSLTPVQVRLPKTLVVTAISGGPGGGVGAAIVHPR